MQVCHKHCPPGGGAAVVAVPVAVAVVVVLFVLAHLALLAACAGVFVVVMGGFLAAARWAVSDRRWRALRYPQPRVRVTAARTAAAITAPPKAIEAARVIPARVIISSDSERIRP